MAAHHVLMQGNLHLYKRDGSNRWQCSTFLDGRNHRISTKEESYERAKDFAEDWFLTLKGKHRLGIKIGEKTFREAAEKFLREYEAITEGRRNAQYVEGHVRRVKLYLIPYFGRMGLSQVTSGALQEYRIHRRETAIKKRGKPPARSTIHQEVVMPPPGPQSRQAARVAQPPARPVGAVPGIRQKITHRAWFSPEEYQAVLRGDPRAGEKPEGKR